MALCEHHAKPGIRSEMGNNQVVSRQYMLKNRCEGFVLHLIFSERVVGGLLCHQGKGSAAKFHSSLVSLSRFAEPQSALQWRPVPSVAPDWRTRQKW